MKIIQTVHLKYSEHTKHLQEQSKIENIHTCEQKDRPF